MVYTGNIQREEIEKIKTAVAKALRTTLVASTFYRIYLTLLTVFVSLFFCQALLDRQELAVMECVFLGITISFWWKNHSKRRKSQKNLIYIENTDKILGYPQEYDFVVDDEKIYVSNTVTIKYEDIASAVVANGYTILTSKDKISVIIATDNDQQMFFYNYCSENNLPFFSFPFSKKEPFANKQLTRISAETKKKKNQQRAKKELIYAAVPTGIVFICVLIIGVMNNNTARDKNEYQFYNYADYPMHQMSENYNYTKSYKALHDIYFDWMAQTQKTIVAVKQQDDTIIEIKILYTNENNTRHYILYQDSPEKQIRIMQDEFVFDWESKVKSLSDFKALADRYPYILHLNDFSFMGCILTELKDKHLFTVENEKMFITYTPYSYLCQSDNGDYSYTIYLSVEDVSDPQQLSQHLSQMADKCNSEPYESATGIAEDILAVFEFIE